MKKKATYRWFVEPLDAFTNDVLSAAVPKLGFANETAQITGPNKTKRQAWEVDSRFIARAQTSKKSFPLNFRVFVRRGNDGLVREWKFHAKKKQSRKIIKAKKELEKIQKK
jgi:hypothetical protein